MNAAADFFAALADAERLAAAGARLTPDAERFIVEHVARRHGLPPATLRAVWEQKRIAVARARAALECARANARTDGDAADAEPEAVPPQ